MNQVTKKPAHKWAVGRSEGGKWIAVATNAPYFCFEGNTVEEVDQKANRALDFYFNTKGAIEAIPLPKLRETTLSTFSPRQIKEREVA